MHEWSGTNVKKENIKPTPITNERYESLTKRHWEGGPRQGLDYIPSFHPKPITLLAYTELQ